MRRRAAVLLAALAALAAGGCGLGAGGGDGPQGVSVRVSADFGTQEILSRELEGVRPGETVLGLLQRQADVRTRFGGGFVQSIDGRAGGRKDGRPVDWFFYVNGIESDVGAGEFRLSPGDRVWWDLRDWGAAMRVPAVVGSFPEPFISGSRGKRIPARIECAEDGAERECDEVAERLQRAGVRRTPRSILSQQEEGGVLRVLVGRWSDLRRDPAAARLDGGPAESGVYARFDASGTKLDVLDERGRVARTLGPGTGLVAATRSAEARPAWIVTGTDEAGLAAAAAALDEALLAGRFAVALEAGQPVSLPVVEP